MTLEATEVVSGVRLVMLPEARVNSVIIADGGHALIVDVGANPMRGAELRRLVEADGSAVMGTVATHSHWDHCFALGAFADVPSYAHRAAVDDLRSTGSEQRDSLLQHSGGSAPDWLYDLQVPIPTDPVDKSLTLRVGALDVIMEPIGHAHSVGDMVVHVPAIGVSALGDLVEIGDPPQLHDADLSAWVEALDRLSLAAGPTLVPGHGVLGTVTDLRAQRNLLQQGIEHLNGRGPGPSGLDLQQLPGSH